MPSQATCSSSPRMRPCESPKAPSLCFHAETVEMGSTASWGGCAAFSSLVLQTFSRAAAAPPAMSSTIASGGGWSKGTKRSFFSRRKCCWAVASRDSWRAARLLPRTRPSTCCAAHSARAPPTSYPPSRTEITRGQIDETRSVIHAKSSARRFRRPTGSAVCAAGRRRRRREIQAGGDDALSERVPLDSPSKPAEKMTTSGRKVSRAGSSVAATSARHTREPGFALFLWPGEEAGVGPEPGADAVAAALLAAAGGGMRSGLARPPLADLLARLACLAAAAAAAAAEPSAPLLPESSSLVRSSSPTSCPASDQLQSIGRDTSASQDTSPEGGRSTCRGKRGVRPSLERQ